MTEHQHQRAIFEWAQYHPICKDYLIANLQGRRTSIQEGRTLKLLGQKKGVSDMFLAYPVMNFNGLWIELKLPKAPPSAITIEQKAWITRMEGVEYMALVGFGVDDTIIKIEAYLAGENAPQAG